MRECYNYREKRYIVRNYLKKKKTNALKRYCIIKLIPDSEEDINLILTINKNKAIGQD